MVYTAWAVVAYISACLGLDFWGVLKFVNIVLLDFGSGGLVCKMCFVLLILVKYLFVLLANHAISSACLIPRSVMFMTSQ